MIRREQASLTAHKLQPAFGGVMLNDLLDDPTACAVIDPDLECGPRIVDELRSPDTTRSSG